MKQTNIIRGDVFWVDFDPSKGTEIQKTRPALICSHDIMNEKSSRVIVAPISSNIKKLYVFEYSIAHSFVTGKVMLDQIRSIDKIRLGKKIGSLPIKEMNEIAEIIRLIMGLQ